MKLDSGSVEGDFAQDADAYSFAVEALRNTLRGLEASNITADDQCDAVGYVLVDLLVSRYSEENALFLMEALQSTLEQYYTDGLGPTPHLTPPATRH